MKKLGKILHGRSNFLGFIIRDKSGREVNSKRYSTGKLINIVTALASVFLIISSIHLVSTGARALEIIASLISGIICLGILYYINSAQFVAEWHAVEHKLIWLLENGNELTLENLKKSPIKSPYCGSGNIDMKEPTDDKLQEAINVGLKYLTLKRRRISLSLFFRARPPKTVWKKDKNQSSLPSSQIDSPKAKQAS